MRHTQRLRNALPTGDFSRGALTIVTGTGAAQLIVIASSPILTRLYSPSAFGVFAAATSILAILTTIACLTYDSAIPLPESDVAGANVVVVCLATTLAMSLATLAVVWLVGPAIFVLVGASTLTPYVLLLPLGELGGGVVMTFIGWAIRTKSYSEIAANRLTQTGALVAGQVGLGLLGWGAVGLLVGAVAGSVAGSSRLARVAWRSHASSFRRVSRAGVSTAAIRYRRFPILSAPSALLNTLGGQAPLLLIVALFGADVGGHLALAQRVIALPVTLLSGAIGQVYFAEFARLTREHPEDLRALFWRTTRPLAVTAAGPFLLSALAAPLFFPFVFGQNWSEAGVYVAILAPMNYLQFVTNPTYGTLDVLERQDLHLAREISRLCLMGGAVLAAVALHLPPIGAIGALCLAGCVTYLLYGFISWRAIVAHDAHLPLARETEADLVEKLPELPSQ